MAANKRDVPGVFRFGLVGSGRIAQSHLTALAAMDSAVLNAVVDTRADAAKAAAEQHGCKAFTDYRDPAIPGLIDAVIICAPPNLHHAVARYFLEKGVHVLCEKPLTIRSEDSEDLIQVAKSKALHLMMASKFRYVEDVIKAKAIVKSGILGNIILFENTFCSKVAMKDRWNAKKEISGGGVLIDNGCHSVDIARYLLGPVKDVQVQNGLSAQNLEVEDTVKLQFRTESGVVGMVDLSWSINKESDAYISLFGSEGTLLIGWKSSRYRQDGNSNWITFGNGYDKVAAFRNQLENFIKSVRKEEQPLITAEDALASVKVIESAYASASRDNWIKVGKAA